MASHDTPKFLADEIPKKRKRSRKRERVSLTELKHSFEDQGAFFLKIADLPHFPGAKFRFDMEKPFDAFVCHRGTSIAIEAKTLKTYAAFGSQIRSSQIKGLDSFVAAGGCGFIFLNIRSKKPRINRLLIFDWSEWGRDFSNGWTMKKKELECQPFITGSKGRFDLAAWLKTVQRIRSNRPWHRTAKA
jgi:hypothetical protein